MGFCPISPEDVHVHIHSIENLTRMLMFIEFGLRKDDKIRDLQRNSLRFRNQFDKFNITGGQNLDSFYIYLVM